MNVVRRVGAFFFGSRRRAVTSVVWAVVMVAVFATGSVGYNAWENRFPPRVPSSYFSGSSAVAAPVTSPAPGQKPCNPLAPPDPEYGGCAPGTAPQADPVQAQPQEPYVLQPRAASAASPAQDTGIPGGTDGGIGFGALPGGAPASTVMQQFNTVSYDFDHEYDTDTLPLDGKPVEEFRAERNRLENDITQMREIAKQGDPADRGYYDGVIEQSENRLEHFQYDPEHEATAPASF